MTSKTTMTEATNPAASDDVGRAASPACRGRAAPSVPRSPPLRGTRRWRGAPGAGSGWTGGTAAGARAAVGSPRRARRGRPIDVDDGSLAPASRRRHPPTPARPPFPPAPRRRKRRPGPAGHRGAAAHCEAAAPPGPPRLVRAGRHPPACQDSNEKAPLPSPFRSSRALPAGAGATPVDVDGTPAPVPGRQRGARGRRPDSAAGGACRRGACW